VLTAERIAEAMGLDATESKAKCPECGEALGADADECEECGWSADDDEGDDDDDETDEELAEARRMPRKKSGAAKGNNQFGGKGRSLKTPKVPSDVGGAWATHEGCTFAIFPKGRLQEFVTLAKQAGVKTGDNVDLQTEGDYYGVEVPDAVADKIAPLFDGDDVAYRTHESD